MMQLYYSNTANARKVCTVARYLDAPLRYVRLDLGAGEQRTPEFLALNPNGKVPLLVDGELRLWESTAIACHLSERAGTDLWPRDGRQIEALRWLFWDAHHFGRHGGRLYFEHVIKAANGKDPDPDEVADAKHWFQRFAGVLDAHLRDRDYVLGDRLSVPDFILSGYLPFAQQAQLPLDGLEGIARWQQRLEKIDAWRDPYPAEPAAFARTEAVAA